MIMLIGTLLCLKNGLERCESFTAEFVSLEVIESVSVWSLWYIVWIDKSQSFLLTFFKCF